MCGGCREKWIALSRNLRLRGENAMTTHLNTQLLGAGRGLRLLTIGQLSWRRIARNIRADSKRLGLKPLVFK